MFKQNNEQNYLHVMSLVPLEKMSSLSPLRLAADSASAPLSPGNFAARIESKPQDPGPSGGGRLRGRDAPEPSRFRQDHQVPYLKYDDAVG